jgi:Fe(3+) dicitrate transport protein
LDTAFNDTIKGFSILILLLFSLSSIAQNKIAGVITDGDGKINAVEVYNKTTNIKVFTDALAL